jgi:ferredoxin
MPHMEPQGFDPLLQRPREGLRSRAGRLKGMALEVRVSRARCIATQSCIHAAPGVFELDEYRISTVVDPEGDPLEAVVEAAESCPTGAIAVFRDGEQLA